MATYNTKINIAVSSFNLMDLDSKPYPVSLLAKMEVNKVSHLLLVSSLEKPFDFDFLEIPPGLMNWFKI